MTLSWLKRTPRWKIHQPRDQQRRRDRVVLAAAAAAAAAAAIEPLDRRVLLAVTATLAGGTLFVTGDDQDNAITVSRNAGGVISVNNGAVAITGGPANLGNTNHFHIVGAGGNDMLALDETSGPLPGAALFGGAGNDVLTGGSAIDFADGGAGADSAFLGGGDDTFQWNPGDGSDLVEGQGGGGDDIVFNGSADAEHFNIASNVNRVLLTRDIGNVAIDLDGLETINLNANGDADTVTINDQTATGLTTLNLDLGFGIGGDGAADAVIMNGTSGDDAFQIASFDNGTRFAIGATLFPFVNVTGAEAANDRLTVSTFGGSDVVDAGSLAANSIQLTLNGGAGNDELLAGGGDDLVNGGAGDDHVFLETGDDTFAWNPGDGNDTVEGQGGADTLVFNGSAASETIGFSANNGHLRVTRATDNVVLDAGDVEQVNVSTGHLSDIFTVGDLSATDVTALKLNVDPDPQNQVGGSAVDRIDIDGTAGDDSMQFLRTVGGFIVTGLHAQISVDGIAADNDLVFIHALAGNDTVIGGAIPANFMLLAIDGGSGNDSLRGTQGNDAIVGGSGDDVALLEGGDDFFLWNPGDGNDTVQGNAGHDEVIFNAPPPGSLPAAGGAISFDGGDDSDALRLLGSAGADAVVYHDASISVGGGGGAALTITHVDVETRTFDGHGGGDDLVIDGGGVELAATQKLASLSISGDGVLDIRTHSLIIDYSAGGASPIGVFNGLQYTGVTGLIQRGAIVSSDATGVTGISVAEAADVAAGGTFAGQAVDATAVLVKFTYAGDANLDGLIDASDYGLIDNFIQFPGTSGYFNGDFNYDGVIDAGDYGIIDNSIQLQGPPL